MDNNTFASRLVKARKKANMTQSEVANELKVAQTIISRYETGKLEPSIQTLTQLIELYEINADWLLGTGMNR